MLKPCTKCGIPKKLSEFYKDSGKRDGRRNECVDCQKRARNQRYRDNLEHNRGQNRAYKEINRERMAESWQRYVSGFDGFFTRSISNCRGRTKQRNSRYRNHEAPTIDLEWCRQQWDLQDGLDYWVGVKMVHEPNSPYTASIDRLDNTKGYHPANCVLTTVPINLIRRDMTLEQFEQYRRDMINCFRNAPSVKHFGL